MCGTGIDIGSDAYRHVHHGREDLDLARRRLREIDGDVERTLAEHAVGTSLTTIDGLGPTRRPGSGAARPARPAPKLR